MKSCPYYPSSKKVGGATREWCLASRLQRKECVKCDWGKAASAVIANCAQ